MMWPIRVSFSTIESANLLLANDLWMNSGCRQVGLVHLHEIDAHEERLVRTFAASIEIVESRPSRRSRQEMECRRRLLPLITGVLTYSPLTLKSSCAFSPALPDSMPLVTRLNIARSSSGMSGNQSGSP